MLLVLNYLIAGIIAGMPEKPGNLWDILFHLYQFVEQRQIMVTCITAEWTICLAIAHFPIR